MSSENCETKKSSSWSIFSPLSSHLSFVQFCWFFGPFFEKNEIEQNLMAQTCYNQWKTFLCFFMRWNEEIFDETKVSFPLVIASSCHQILCNFIFQKKGTKKSSKLYKTWMARKRKKIDQELLLFCHNFLKINPQKKNKNNFLFPKNTIFSRKRIRKKKWQRPLPGL